MAQKVTPLKEQFLNGVEKIAEKLSAIRTYEQNIMDILGEEVVTCDIRIFSKWANQIADTLSAYHTSY